MQFNEAENMLTEPRACRAFAASCWSASKASFARACGRWRRSRVSDPAHRRRERSRRGHRNVTDEVIDSALRYRVQAPMIDSLMKEIGIEGSGWAA